jgi:archaellum component FlaC
MDQELIAYLDERFRGIDERFRETSEQIEARFEEVKDEIRQTRVEIEGLRGTVRLVAEGVMSVEERLKPFRKDFDQEFENIRGLIRASYANLDTRTHSLESWRERKDRDPLDLIRERFGKKP